MSRPIIKTQSANVNGAASRNINKSVRFNRSARFILIPPSSEETASLTKYTEDDYRRICKSIKKTMRAVRMFHEEYPDGNFDEHQQSLLDLAGEGKDPKHCARGLEHLRSAEFLEQQMINKDCAIEAVLAAQDRLDEEDAQNALDQRIRGVYDHQSSSAENRLNAERLEQRARHIAASYRLHNRWALENALELAAQDALYVEEHVRPHLDRASSSEQATRSVSPLHTLATLQESLVMEGPVDSDSNAKKSPRRPHAPSRIHPSRPTTNWLQHRDSLQLGLENKAATSSS